jgi:putative oxygen-independent coproporphyrinogen III oxidase
MTEFQIGVCVAIPPPPFFGSSSSSLTFQKTNNETDQPIMRLLWNLLHALATGPTQTAPIGVYVHIPFCRRRCRYCDFAIVPIGQKPPSTIMADEYTAALLREMETLEGPIQAQSLYIGGGTPSLAPVEMLQAIVDALEKVFVFDPTAERTIEMDPGTFDLEKLQAIKQMGFNRISLGVQSFDDAILERLGRVHCRRDVFESVALLEQVFQSDLSYSMDLISGLPGLDCAKWTETLQTALSLGPQHLSLYDLQIEEETVFGVWYNNKKEIPRALPLPSEEDSSFMYKYAAGYLAARGFEHYEVSSYALPGFRSRHNQVYWAYEVRHLYNMIQVSVFALSLLTSTLLGNAGSVVCLWLGSDQFYQGQTRGTTSSTSRLLQLEATR